MIGDPDSCGFFRVLFSGFLNDPYKDKGFSLRSVVVFFLWRLYEGSCVFNGVFFWSLSLKQVNSEYIRVAVRSELVRLIRIVLLCQVDKRFYNSGEIGTNLRYQLHICRNMDTLDG
jgi:hypothetical protein